jgi:hypothetical protein
MEPMLVQGLADKSLTKSALLKLVEQDYGLVPGVLAGVASSKAAVRYGCAAVLMELSEKHPKPLYPYWDSFVALLESKRRILVWNGLAILANLCTVDMDKKFDGLCDKYYGFLADPYMVTVANVVANSAKIARSKPYLIPRVTRELLKVKEISTTPHLTEECKLVIAEKAVETFSSFFGKLDAAQKKQVILFAKSYVDSSRKTLSVKAARFLEVIS